MHNHWTLTIILRLWSSELDLSDAKRHAEYYALGVIDIGNFGHGYDSPTLGGPKRGGGYLKNPLEKRGGGSLLYEKLDANRQIWTKN